MPSPFRNQLTRSDRVHIRIRNNAHWRPIAARQRVDIKEARVRVALLRVHYPPHHRKGVIRYQKVIFRFAQPAALVQLNQLFPSLFLLLPVLITNTNLAAAISTIGFIPLVQLINTANTGGLELLIQRTAGGIQPFNALFVRQQVVFNRVTARTGTRDSPSAITFHQTARKPGR